MSWSLSAVGTDGQDARDKLAEQNDQQGAHMPVAVAEAIVGLVDMLPEPLPGYGSVSITTNGHLGEAGQGTSSISISVSQVADLPSAEQPAAA